MRILNALERQPKPILFALSLVVLLALAAVDMFAGADISFFALYLAPIALATWYVGRGAGWALVGASSLLWIADDLISFAAHSHPLVLSWNVTVLTAFFIAAVQFLWWLQQSLSREQELSRTDPLTGVANRRAFFELAAQELYRAKRYKRPVTLVFIDVDDFKYLNDNFGHATGDALLRQIGQTVKRALRVTDIFARLGGDEFAILLPEVDAATAQAVIRKLQQVLSSVVQEDWSVTFSLGAVTCVDPAITADEMLQVADEVMYEVKRNGKNNVRYETIEGSLVPTQRG